MGEVPSRWRQIKELFHAALEQPPGELDAWLAHRCAGDSELQREVRSLVEAESSAGVVFEERLNESLFGGMARHSLTSPVGLRLGPYELVSELGRGGSATVYLARRHDDLYRKEVAVKLLHRPCVSEDVRQRYLRELRVLARLDHPYVGRLLDAGTTETGLAYIVMERVDGIPVDEFCRRGGLRLNTRLELFLKICGAVAAAHRNLVVHRDLKPSNILVVDDGSPRLMDFGIARLLDDDESLTQTGFARMTLRYASPEQVRGEAAVSTASDIYSLGVLLYEMLTGCSPYGAALSGSELPAAILERAPVPPRDVNRTISQDLEAVILTALSKVPEVRYSSVERLAEDVENALHSRPVRVRRRGRLQAAIKYVERHPWGSSIAAAGVLALGFLGAFLMQQARAADAKVRQLNASVARITHEWDRGGRVQPASVLRAASESYIELLQLSGAAENTRILPQVIALLFRVGMMQGHPAEENVGDVAGAIRTIEYGVWLEERLFASNPRAPTSHGNLADAIGRLGSVYLEAGRTGEAETLFRRAVALTADAREDDTSYVSRRSAYADAISNLSRILLRKPDAAGCLKLRREAVAVSEELLRTRDRSVARRVATAGFHANLGWALRHFGRYDEAATAYARSTAMLEAIEEPGARLEVRSRLARNAEQQARIELAKGQVRQAEARLRQAVGELRRTRELIPISAASRRLLASMLSVWCVARRQLGESGPEIDRIGLEAIGLLQAEVQRDPANAMVKEELARVSAELAQSKPPLPRTGRQAGRVTG